MADTVQSIKLMFMVGSATGAGWLFAILVLFQVGGAGMQYVFTVANAFQGCLIFTCHILLKEEGRSVVMSMKRSLFSTTTGTPPSRSKNNNMTRGVQQQTEQRSGRLTCAWRSNVNGIGSSNAILATCSLVSVECVNDVGRRRSTNYDDNGSVGDLSKDEMVYDVAGYDCSGGIVDKDEVVYYGATPDSTVYLYVGDSRTSSPTYIDLVDLEENAPDPPLIRRSDSYSTAVAADCITVTTNISAVRVSSGIVHQDLSFVKTQL
jgi:hypothetical protein